MHIVNVNGTTSYHCYLQFEARRTVAEMSSGERRRTLDNIQLNRVAHHILDRPYDTKLSDYIEKLLTT